jgi:L-ascorbate metabolism protein UlaG (beta-lactamase superfamily)
VDWDGFRLALDLGYGTLPRLLAQWRDGAVDAVVITHEHPDHCVYPEHCVYPDHCVYPEHCVDLHGLC